MESAEVNLVDYWRVLLKWKRSLLIIVFLMTVVAVIISLRLPKSYSASATIMQVGGGGGGGLSMSMLVGLVGGGSSSNNQILVILKSRILAERVITKYNLMSIFYKDAWDEQNHRWKSDDPKKVPSIEDAIDAFFSCVTFVEDRKYGTITVKGIMPTPQLAADIVNSYLDELAVYMNENTFTGAKRNRVFVEKQLERNKRDLLESGKELTDFYATNKVSNINPMVDVDISVEAAGDMQEVTGAPGPLPVVPNPLSVDIQKQAEYITSKIKQAKVVPGVPQQVYLQYLGLRRQLLGQINALLTQQYEMAKIEETKEGLNFQVIDLARVPVKRYKPKRRKIVMTSFAVSVFAGIFYAFFRECLEKMKSNQATV